jgi:5'-nucleotidase
MKLLLSNDDGVNATGIWALHDALAPIAEIVVVAPEREQSASSHALTLHTPLRIRKLRDRVYAVDGTPTDCVLLAVRGLGGELDFKPDFVISGINHGPNLGDDVTYSGTVAAAFEGHLLGIPSIAFSDFNAGGDHIDAARAARILLEQLAEGEVPSDLLLNVNFPELPFDELKGFRIAGLGKRRYEDVIEERVDPRGRTYYWLGGSPTWDDDPASDMAALSAGYISVTPMHLALTDEKKLAPMKERNLKLR